MELSYSEQVQKAHKLIDEALQIIAQLMENMAYEQEKLNDTLREGLEELRLRQGDYRPFDIIGGAK